MRLTDLYQQLRRRRQAAINARSVATDPDRIVLQLPQQKKQTLESMTRAAQTRSGKRRLQQ